MIHVVFVCSYNRGRSVMAAAMFAHQLQQRGLGDVVRVSSAGTSLTCADAGPADERAYWVLHQHGYPVLRAHRTQLLNADRLNADLIVALGYEHVGLLRKWGVKAERLRYVEVANPWLLAHFEAAYVRIEAAMPALHAWVKEHIGSTQLGTTIGWRFWLVRPGTDLLLSPYDYGPS